MGFLVNKSLARDPAGVKLYQCLTKNHPRWLTGTLKAVEIKIVADTLRKHHPSAAPVDELRLREYQPWRRYQECCLDDQATLLSFGGACTAVSGYALAAALTDVTIPSLWG